MSLSRLQGDMRKECEMGSLGSSVLLCDGVADLGPGSALSLSLLGFDSDKLHHLQTQALSPSGEQFLKAQVDHLSASMSDLVAELQEDGTGTSLGHMPGGFFTLAHKLEHLSASLQAAEGHGGALRQCANPTLGGDVWMPSLPKATQLAIPGAVAPPTSLAQAPHLMSSALQQWQLPAPTSGISSPGLPCTLLYQDSQPHCPSTACLAHDASAVCGKRRREQHAPSISQDCIERTRSSSELSNTSKETGMQHAAAPHLSALCAEQAQLIKRLQDEKQLLVSHSMALSARLAALEGPAACTGTLYPAPCGPLAVCAPAWQATPGTASQHPCTSLYPPHPVPSGPAAVQAPAPAARLSLHHCLDTGMCNGTSPPAPNTPACISPRHTPAPRAPATATALCMPGASSSGEVHASHTAAPVPAYTGLEWPQLRTQQLASGMCGTLPAALQQAAPALLHQAPAPGLHTAAPHQARVAMQQAHVVGTMPQDGLMAQLAAQMEVARAALQHLRCTRSQE